MNDTTLPTAAAATVKKQTRSQKEATDLAALLRARNSLVWIVTKEEARVERYVYEAAAAARYKVYLWDVAQGVSEVDGTPRESLGSRDPGETLNAIRSQALGGTERAVWIMRDLPVWLSGGISGAAVMRQLRNLSRMLPGVPMKDSQAVVILSPDGNVPPELAGHATVIDWPIPDRDEVASILATLIKNQSQEMQDAINAELVNGKRDSAIDAAVGLTGEEAASCYSKSLVQTRRIDPALVGAEKKRVISRERVLEWYDPLPGGLDSVGGLENLKRWLVSRAAAWTTKARDYGLPAPKGCLLVGIPGTGKSLTAKAIATAWKCPLIKWDLGAMKGKFVGESESKFRTAIETIKALGRVVVWIDEIEKALAGATDGAADGGVSQDQLGQILTFMQEQQSGAFVIATANDISKLPPELLRKGRFDELWFVDLPTESERGAILAATLKTFKREPTLGMLMDVSAATRDWTGAEIAAIVPEAMFTAFADGAREITTEDLLEAAANVTPLSTTAPEKIKALRDWGRSRARRASAEEAATVAAPGRQLDL